MMSSLPTGGLESLESAYQLLGQVIDAMKATPQAGVVPARSYIKHSTAGPSTRQTLKCRSYIKYPSPEGLRPRAAQPFKVADLCKAYNFPTGMAGGGVIGILELGGGYKQSDLDQFSRLNGLPQIVPADVPMSGGQNSPGGADDGEVLLDIQVAAAAYFFCTGQLPSIQMMFAPNSDTAFADALRAAVAAGCDILSISWGKDEAAWDPNVANQVEAAAQDAAGHGCVVFAASGDNSSGDGAPGANVDMPSSCPHIIGCGGTTKTQAGEVVWGDGTPNGNGTGGGYSALFPPQSFQVGAPPSPGRPGRMVPDVAANADPDTGYLVVINGEEVQVGGTSAVAPLYSGLFAAFGKRLGFVTPTLWQHPEAFVDITEGSNGSFSAARGPDPCTGLGVPKGKALAALFASKPARAKRAPR
jgi:kumamolisin